MQFIDRDQNNKSLSNQVQKIPIWDSDNTQLFLILIFSSFLIYFTDPILSRIGYFVLLIWAYLSKKYYIWVAFLMIINETPNYFYFGGAADDPLRVPIYTIIKGISFAFEDLLVFVLFACSYKKMNRFSAGFRNIFFIFFLLFMFTFFIGAAFGINFKNLLLTIRYIIPLFLIPSIIKLLPKNDHWVALCKILFPIVIFTFIGQMYFIFTFKPLVTMISAPMVQKLNTNFLYYSKGVGPSRFITGGLIIFFSFIVILYFLNDKKYVFNKLYLYLIMILAIVQIILSATRGYTIAFFLILLLWLTLQRFKQLPKVILVSCLFGIIFMLAAGKNSIIEKQIIGSIDRLETIERLAEGDLTAGNSYGRLTIKTPVVLKKFKQSPIYGFGFSDEYYKNQDDHVAIPNLLLNLGIIGFLIFHLGLFALTKKIMYIGKTRQGFPYESKLFLIGLMGILAVHLFTRQMFGFTLPPYVHIFIVVYYCFWITVINNNKNNLIIKCHSN